MICQMCKSREATGIQSLGLKGNTLNVYLCDDCSKRALSNNVFGEKYRNDFWQTEEIDIKCDICKTKLSDFEETGYVGCENCYKTFENEISKFARDINGKDVYVGKIPEKLLNKISRSAELAQLRKKLSEAIESGDRIQERQIKAKILKIGGAVNA